jgi:hypothetical protein
MSAFGSKQTSLRHSEMSAFDPKRTFGPLLPLVGNWLSDLLSFWLSLNGSKRQEGDLHVGNLAGAVT